MYVSSTCLVLIWGLNCFPPYFIIRLTFVYSRTLSRHNYRRINGGDAQRKNVVNNVETLFYLKTEDLMG